MAHVVMYESMISLMSYDACFRKLLEAWHLSLLSEHPSDLPGQSEVASQDAQAFYECIAHDSCFLQALYVRQSVAEGNSRISL